jgi:transcriptional regulator with XRE-family HTH domain
MKETFGTVLKNIRRLKNISQRELADKVGVDFTYISKIENDRLPPPSAETVIKISEVLGSPKEILLSQSGKVSNDLKDVMSSPEAIKFLHEVKEMNLSSSEWQSLHRKLKSLR